MKITKKLLAACVAALALSMPLMGCNGGNTAKPVGSAAGSASKQTTEKKESNKPADDRIELPPPPGIGLLFCLYPALPVLWDRKCARFRASHTDGQLFSLLKLPSKHRQNARQVKAAKPPMGLRRSSGDIFARSLMPQARSSPCRPCRDAAPREW